MAPRRRGEAVACAEAFPQFALIVAQDGSDLARATPVWASNPKTGAKTMILSLGHKAKAVGVVGVYRTGKAAQPFELRYQLVEMSEDFATPKGQEATQPILELMEKYTKELKDGDYLHKIPQVNHANQAGRTRRPIRRHGALHRLPHFRGEGVEGDGEQPRLQDAGGRNEAIEPAVRPRVHRVPHGRFRLSERIPVREGDAEAAERQPTRAVTGPAACTPTPRTTRRCAQMNPWKAPENEKPEEKTRRTIRIGDFCQKCHDAENDVNWTGGGFEKNWPKIAHPTPPEEK